MVIVEWQQSPSRPGRRLFSIRSPRSSRRPMEIVGEAFRRKPGEGPDFQYAEAAAFRFW
jgi:hypothetical protein